MMYFSDLTLTQWLLPGLIGLMSVFYIYVKRKQTYWKRQGLSGPEPIFLLGNTLADLSEPLAKCLSNNHKKYGKLYGSYNGLQPRLIVGDPELVRHICVKDFAIIPQGFDHYYLTRVEREFLVNIWGEKWKRIRSTLSPTFSTVKMKKMFNLLKLCNKEGQEILAKFTANGDSHIDFIHFWGRYNIDVIARCCYAANLDVYNNEDDTILRKFVAISQTNHLMLFIRLTLPYWFSKLFKISEYKPENLEFLRDLTLALIEKRKEGEQKNIEDFLQLLIHSEVDSTEGNQADKKLTLDEIVGASANFLGASYETTTTLLAWACYRLAKNLEIQEKLFDEVSKADIENYDELSKLPYLDAVIMETLRIDPPALFFRRMPHSDYILPGKNVLVKRGTVIDISVYAIHHDPDNYPDPEIFNPCRFLENAPKPFTFLPFGAGPRTCIGMRFALINAKLALASFIRNYQIFTDEKTESKVEHPKGAIIPKPENLVLGIKSRTN